ncbi:MAG: hypothetical protein AAF418_04865, partial [Pseudomonadota bacterium]
MAEPKNMQNTTQPQPKAQVERESTHDQIAAFIRKRPWLRWMHENLFSSIPNAILTLLVIICLVRFIPPLLNWLFIDAVWFAESRTQCRAIDSGACWAFIIARFEQFLWGFYPEGQRWRL